MRRRNGLWIRADWSSGACRRIGTAVALAPTPMNSFRTCQPPCARAAPLAIPFGSTWLRVAWPRLPDVSGSMSAQRQRSAWPDSIRRRIDQEPVIAVIGRLADVMLDAAGLNGFTSCGRGELWRSSIEIPAVLQPYGWLCNGRARKAPSTGCPHEPQHCLQSRGHRDGNRRAYPARRRQPRSRTASRRPSPTGVRPPQHPRRCG